jgi:hypothetical protein
MKGIYIPQYNIAFQFTNKSGSLVMLNTFILFCNFYNITFEHLNRVIDYKKLKVKFYIFTRNPIDRFITSYNWFMDSSKNNVNVNQMKIKYRIDNIDDFIANYGTIMCEIKDTHYEPQLFDVLKYDDKKFNIDIIDINNKLINQYYKYEFIKMESISILNTCFMDKYYYIHGPESNDIIPPDYSKCQILNIISEFNTISYNQKIHFNLLYIAMKSILDIRHHKINDRVILLNKVKNINLNIFNIENTLFGYTELHKTFI